MERATIGVNREARERVHYSDSQETVRITESAAQCQQLLFHINGVNVGRQDLVSASLKHFK